MLWKCFGKGKQKLDGSSPMISDRGKVVPIGELLLEMPKKRTRKADRVKEWGLPKELGFIWTPDEKTWGLPEKLGFVEEEEAPKKKNYNPTISIRTNFTRGNFDSQHTDKGNEFIVTNKTVHETLKTDAKGNKRYVQDKIGKYF